MPSRCQAEYSSALLIHKLFLPCALPFSRSNTATCRALSRCIHHHHRLVIASSLAHVGEIFPTSAGRTVRGIGVGGAIPVHCTVLTRAASTTGRVRGPVGVGYPRWMNVTCILLMSRHLNFLRRGFERETRYGLYRYVILVLSSVHVSPPTTQLGVVGGSIRSRGAAGLASKLPKSYFIICTNRFGRNV